MTRRIEISFSEEDIENILYDDKFTLDVLAKKYNVSRNLISVRLRELNREDISSRLMYRKKNFAEINNLGKNINGRLKARQLILEGWKVAAVMFECGVSCKTAYGFKNELKELM